MKPYDDILPMPPPARVVHYTGPPFEKEAPCGQKYDKRRFFMFARTWNPTAANPVNCPACLKQAPKKRMIATWEGSGKKRR
jgi:hypothetical protein